jgi:outer membrane biosynthesis protein TonB
VSSRPGAGDGQDRLSAALRELQAQVTEDVLNLRARVLALEQELEEVRSQAKAAPPDKQESPATKSGARGTTRRTPATAAKPKPKPKSTPTPKPKPSEAKAPKRPRPKS